jgi:hypothetical protein
VKLGPYNQNTAALPQSYGVYGKLYTDLKYGPNRTIERASNSHLTWDIQANGFYGEPADVLSTPEHYYFASDVRAAGIHRRTGEGRRCVRPPLSRTVSRLVPAQFLQRQSQVHSAVSG